MARFEGALAQACAEAGLVPAHAAQAIVAACQQARFDPRELALAARNAGALAIPFVKALTAQVSARSEEAARYVHLGATSQDVTDTAAVLCMQDAAGRVLELCDDLGDTLAELASRHRDTPMAARTLLQPAAPIPFGWKAAGWLSMLARSREEFRASVRDARALQFGGPAGTLSGYGERAPRVAAALARKLGLREPAIPWHSSRDRFARLGAAAALLTGSAARIARDVSLLMQPEVGEALEPAAPGRGGSSSLPHKRNPAASLLALEAALRAPGLVATLFGQLVPEHERGLGQWQSQWFTLRTLVCGAASGLAAMAEVCAGLEVRAEAMQRNLDRSLGLVYSEAVAMRLSQALGKAAAHAKVEALCLEALQSGTGLRELLAADADVARAVPRDELARLFAPGSSFGAASVMIEAVLEEWRRARAAPAI